MLSPMNKCSILSFFFDDSQPGDLVLRRALLQQE